MFIFENRYIFSLKNMFIVLGVSRSGYYAYLSRPESIRNRSNIKLLYQIKEVFEKSKQRYGFRRIRAELNSQGMQCSKERVRRLMKKHNITARIKKKYKRTTDSNHKLPVALNLVNMMFNPVIANRYWTSDITYIWTSEGWLYLCVVIDLWSRRVIGWKTGRFMDESLVTEAVSKAISIRKPDRGLKLHSDRGSQYASIKLRNMLKENNISQSMSSKGNCYDNAPTESFFATLKRELIYRKTFRTREEAKQQIFEYIEIFYNRYRRHSTLNYLSPVQFENLNNHH
jgi:putative transposase